MRLPCEVAVRSLVPAMRASIARELADRYAMKQSGIAELLNVTQAAVSYYTRELRGAAVNIEKVEEIRQAVEEIAAALASGDWSAPDLTKSFCVACSAARERGLICRLHKKMEPSISLRDCKVCKPDRTSSAKRTR
ncbi:MAG: hypothetical protein OEY99_09180 [Aigarchaeota archaeon]|nr:hypothetical protein [Aigarchaeota archaeon]MDH5704374.1 hypothetical protein [Aigarchaeota archaeon]